MSLIVDFFKWGGAWTNICPIPLMKRITYCRVRVDYREDSKEKSQEYIIPSYDMNYLEREFEKSVSHEGNISIAGVEVLARSNAIKDLEEGV